LEKINSIVAKGLICALLLVCATKPANANSIPTNSDIVWIGIAIGAIGAGIGIGVYYAVHHGHSLKGCVVAGPEGLELRSEGGQQTYDLVGAVTGIKPGQRVRVSGKMMKKSNGAERQFLVETLNRDYGVCSILPTTP
jgi:hypothetical protein